MSPTRRTVARSADEAAGRTAEKGADKKADQKAMAPRPARLPKVLPAEDAGRPVAELVAARIASFGGDWRGERLAQLRQLILAADPAVVEEWKWNIPVWSCQGLICTGEVYQKVVKLTFAQGAALPDPAGLFNASLEGKVRRAIDVNQAAMPDEAALTALVRAAIAHNRRGRGAGG